MRAFLALTGLVATSAAASRFPVLFPNTTVIASVLHPFPVSTPHTDPDESAPARPRQLAHPTHAPAFSSTTANSSRLFQTDETTRPVQSAFPSPGSSSSATASSQGTATVPALQSPARNNGPASASFIALGLAPSATRTLSELAPAPLNNEPPGASHNIEATTPARQSSAPTLDVFSEQRVHHSGRLMSIQQSDVLTQNVEFTPVRFATADATQTGNSIEISVVGPGVVLTRSESPRPTGTNDAASTNALGILLSALPTSVIESIETKYSITFPGYPLETTSNRLPPTSRPTSSASTSRSSTRSSTTHSSSTTSTPTSSTTSTLSTSSSRTSSITSTSSTSSSRTSPTTTATSTTFLTSTTTSSPVSSTPSATTTTPAPTGNPQISSGAIAGATIGSVAGAVLILMTIIFLLRRKQQGRTPFGLRSKGSRRAYPEVAWLYDPAPTPPRGSMQQQRQHYGGEESAAALLHPPHPLQHPDPVARDFAGGRNVGYGNNPPFEPARPESPLLPIQRPEEHEDPEFCYSTGEVNRHASVYVSPPASPPRRTSSRFSWQ